MARPWYSVIQTTSSWSSGGHGRAEPYKPSVAATTTAAGTTTFRTLPHCERSSSPAGAQRCLMRVTGELPAVGATLAIALSL